MYEFHGWFGLAETASEADIGGFPEVINEINAYVGWFTPPQAMAEVRPLNGHYFLWVNGLVNRSRDEAGALHDLLAYLAKRLPGSWGLLFGRDDEWTDPPLANSFRVRVLARGQVSTREDTLLSPCRPTIED